MKVKAPIAELKELEPLARSGAEELYCGVTPLAWVKRFSGAVWANRRGPAGGNILDLAGLKVLTAEAHKLGLPVHLAINSQYHTPEQMEILREVIRAGVEDAAVDSLILGDLGLILAARELYPTLRFMASSIGVPANRETVAFYRELGARRIIFPRHLTMAEMEALIATAPDLEYEAFALNDGCVFEEGYCHTQHGVSGMPSFCLTDWDEEVHRIGDGRPAGEEHAERWAENLKDHRDWLGYALGRDAAVNARGLPIGHCGLCAIPEMARIGIHALKVVGREAGLHRKIRSVQLVRGVLDRVRAGASRREACEHAIALRGDPEACRSGFMCYYREVQDFLNAGGNHPAAATAVRGRPAGGGASGAAPPAAP
jgi:U32 family peptidase